MIIREKGKGWMKHPTNKRASKTGDMFTTVYRRQNFDVKSSKGLCQKWYEIAASTGKDTV